MHYFSYMKKFPADKNNRFLNLIVQHSYYQTTLEFFSAIIAHVISLQTILLFVYHIFLFNVFYYFYFMSCIISIFYNIKTEKKRGYLLMQLPCGVSWK